MKAILGHISSSEEVPHHEYCPDGSSSWCSYQRDIANGTSFHKAIKNPLAPAIVEKINPLFQKFGDKQFLSAVEKCYTTNANESFHHVLWNICPKEQYTSPKEFSLSLNLAVGIFNEGITNTYSLFFKMLNLPFTENMKKSLMNVDKKRINESDYKSKLTVRQKRRERKSRKTKKMDAFKHVEGTQYKSQQFI